MHLSLCKKSRTDVTCMMRRILCRWRYLRCCGTWPRRWKAQTTWTADACRSCAADADQHGSPHRYLTQRNHWDNQGSTPRRRNYISTQSTYSLSKITATEFNRFEIIPSKRLRRGGEGGENGDHPSLNFSLSENCPLVENFCDIFCPKIRNLGLKVSPF